VVEPEAAPAPRRFVLCGIPVEFHASH
jgi:hypothetical protein